MEEKEKRKKGKERGKAGSENIREGIPSAPVLSDFVQGIHTKIPVKKYSILSTFFFI